jgi:BirA family biotin operon repressor/biotin-[acetyl-CoA-carboxylase] ligase
LLRPPGEAASSIPLLTLAAGTATSAALEGQVECAPLLKWPNDLHYDGVKVGGILTEAHANSDRVTSVVVGIGINLLQDPKDFPPDFQATSVAAATERRPHRAELAARILDELEAGYRNWLRSGFGPVIDAWKRRSSTLGRKVSVRQNGILVEGRAADLADDGSLVVRTQAGTVSVHAGEVTEIGVRECSS